jgi:hypothetical protein
LRLGLSSRGVKVVPHSCIITIEINDPYLCSITGKHLE